MQMHTFDIPYLHNRSTEGYDLIEALNDLQASEA